MKTTRSKLMYPSKSLRSLTYIITGLSILPLSSIVSAGGFQLSDHSVTALGRSQAGYGMVGDDASAVHFNPAGMTLLEHQVQLGASFNAVDAEFSDAQYTQSGLTVTGEDEDGAQNGVTPNIYYVLPLNDSVYFGLGITAPYATHTDYSDDFIGRYAGLKTFIKTIDFNPSIGLKLNEHLSIGMGVSYQTIEATLGSALSPLAPGSELEIEGTGDGLGYNAGVMYSINQNHNVGLSYRSEINHQITGDATFANFGALSGEFDASTEFTSPATAHLGYNGKIGTRFSLSAGARWTEWSTLDEIIIAMPTAAVPGFRPGAVSIETRWDNSMTYTLGGDFLLNDQFILRAGIARDETPVPDEYRSVRTIDSDRTWYSLGASYKPSEKVQLDFALRHITFEDAPVDYTTSTGGLLEGNYDGASINTVAVQINYKL